MFGTYFYCEKILFLTVVTYMESKSKRGDLCIRRADALCCTAETNTTL